MINIENSGHYQSRFEKDIDRHIKDEHINQATLVETSDQPTYQQWLKDCAFGHYVCMKCELEIDSNIVGIMFDDNIVLTTHKGAYICPMCDCRVLQWWTQKDGVVFFE